MTTATENALRPSPVRISGDPEAAEWLLGVLRDEAASIDRRRDEERARLGHVPYYLEVQHGNAMHWIGQLEDERQGRPEGGPGND